LRFFASYNLREEVFVRLLLLFALTVPMLAGEYAVLASGFRLHAEKHEVIDGTVRLFTSDGVIELPASSVASFEVEDFVAPEQPEAPPAAPSVREMIDRAAERYGLPPEFLHSVAAVESAYQTGAVSHKGAIGLMQLMPGTAAELEADPHDPLQNVDAGARHLRDLLLRYDGGVYHALAAYNAGQGAVSKYQGIPPYRETQNYVRKVVKRYQTLSEKSRTASEE